MPGIIHSKPTVFVSESAPADHNPNWPIVIPTLIPGRWRGGELSFASIIALEPGQQVWERVHQSIEVFSDDQGYTYDFGLCAFDRLATLIQCKVEFPELLGRLRKIVRGMEKLIKTKSHEKPWLNVKNWHEGDIDLKIEVTPLTPDAAIRVFQSWPSWEDRKLAWGDRLNELSVWGVKNFQSMSVNSFEKFCAELGLHKGDKKELSQPLQAVFDACELAHQLVQSVKPKM